MGIDTEFYNTCLKHTVRLPNSLKKQKYAKYFFANAKKGLYCNTVQVKW